MRPSIKMMLVTGILGAVSLLGSGTPAARAQGYYYTSYTAAQAGAFHCCRLTRQPSW